MITVTLSILDDDGYEEEYTFPAIYDVCENCEGHGTHLNPNIRNHAFTSEEWAEEDDDFKTEYMRHGGIYDVQCEVCHGTRVIAVPDKSKFTPNDYKLFEQWSLQKAEQIKFENSGGYDY